MGRPEAVILDIDGTLLLSNDAHAHAFVDAATELGFDGADFQAVRRLIGMGGDKLIPTAFGFEAESEKGERLDERKGEIFRGRYANALQPTPGARELLTRFREDGLRLVVATSAGSDDLKILLERAGVSDLVDGCTTSSDVESSKPDPDVVRAALDLASSTPSRTVMIGDTPYDVEASLAAGVRIIGFRTGGWTDEDLRGATAVYTDPAELLQRYHESVFR
jgi:HAD superfamily hydrolase (TIGR01509 family)